MNHTLTSDPGTAGTDPQSRPSRVARGAVAAGALVIALSLATPVHRAITDSPARAETQTQTPVVDRGRPALAGSPVRRPVSADAAERWWLDCTADLPTTPDAAERRLAWCW